LKMEFERQYGRIINLKKVRRIMKDFNLVTKIRKKSRYKAIEAEGKEHSVAPNIVQRQFNNPFLRLMDLTEFRVRGGQKLYLFAVKNAKTREIVVHALNTRPSISFVSKALRTYLEKTSLTERRKLIFHSDQGIHFTCKEIRDLLVEFGVQQSMSRRGNCLDNAPIESFFGHLKDEVDYKFWNNYKTAKRALSKYMHYYNYDRPQWVLKQKTPAEARVLNSLD
jgi:putative transposase